MSNIYLINADAAHIPLADKSIHCIVTSPPYWGLRKYEGVKPTIWPSITYTPMPGLPSVTIPGDAECEHVWGGEQPIKQSTPIARAGRFGDGDGHGRVEKPSEIITIDEGGVYCQGCGAWRGCLGLEPTPKMYVAHLVLIFRELRRVLRDDGVAWLNLGDSYAGSNCGSNDYRSEDASISKSDAKYQGQRPGTPSGLKPKDLCFIPHRVAMALQADGWWVRSDIVWVKGLSFCDDYAGSCMPESVTDRPAKAHEYLFLLSKNKRYYYDNEAVKERSIDPNASFKRYESPFYIGNKESTGAGRPDGAANTPGMKKFDGTRNLRDCWAINPGSYKGAHYAVFPPALVEPRIKAGCPDDGMVRGPFSGSGTTAEEGRRFGRDAILVE